MVEVAVLGNVNFLYLNILLWIWDSVVSIATGYGLDDAGVGV
jgi:hypothetical protein